MAVAPKQNAVEILARLVPLNTLSEAGLSELLDSAVFEKLKRGAVLFKEGDTESLNVYLLSGKVALLSGKQEMDTVDAKDDTARFPLAHQVPRKFTVVARSRVEVVRVDNRLLGQLIAQASSSPYEVAAVDRDAPDDWMSQLLQLPVFQQLPPANIQRVIMGMEEIELEQGAAVFGQGDEGDHFYLINKGQCSISRSTGDEQEELARPGPGESFGEESLLSGRPRAGSATMLRAGTLVRLAKARFLEIVIDPLFQRVSHQQALDAIELGALWLDVRPSPTFEKAHLTASINLPLSSLRYQSSSLDPDRNYIVCCSDTGDQATAAYLLLEQGFKVTLLEGGMPEAMVEKEEQKPAVQDGEVVDLHPAKVVADEADTGSMQDDEEHLQQRLIKAELLARQQHDQLKKLQQELKQAGSRLARAEQQETEFEDRTATLDEEAGRLRQTLKEKSDALAGLVEQAARIDALQAEKTTVEACLADLEDTITSLQQTLEEERAKQSQAGSRIEALEQQQDQSARERDAAREQVQALEQQLTGREQTASQQQEQLEALQNTLQETQQQSEAQLQRLDEIERERQQATQQLDAAHGEAEALRSQLSEAEQRLQASAQQAEDGQQELDEARQRLEQAQEKEQTWADEREEARAELGNASERISELEQALQTQQTDTAIELQAARDQLQQLEQMAQAQEHSSQEALQEISEQLEQAQQQLTEQTPQLAQAQQQLTEQTPQLAQAQQQLTEQTQQLEQAQQQLTEQTRQLEQVLLDKEAADEQLVSVRQEITLLEARLSDEAGAGQAELDELHKQLDSSQQALDQARTGQVEAQRQLEEQRQETASATQQLSEAEQRLNELKLLQQQFEASQQALEEAQLEQNESQQRLVELQREYAAAQRKLQDGEVDRSGLEARLSGEVDTLQARQTTLQEQLEVREGELADAKAERQSIDEQLQALRQGREQAEQARITAEQKLQELETRLSENSVASEQHYAAQQQLIEQLQQDLATEKERFGETGHALVQLELEKSKAADELRTLKEVLQQRDVELGRQMQALAQAEKTLEQRDTGNGQDLEQLRNELNEACQARDVAEARLQQQQSQAVVGDGSDSGEQKALRAEIKTLTDALEESDKSYDEMAARVAQLESNATADGVGGNDAAAEQLLNDKQAAEQEVERLGAEVADLRSVMAQYVRQVQAAQEGGESESVDALHTELELVREQAETDLASMREELEAVQSRLHEQQLSGSAEVAEKDALKQELAELSRRLEQQQEDARQARGGQNNMLEDVELNKSEINRLKEALEIATVEAEEAEFKRKEEIEMRMQLEQSLYQLQQEMGESRARELLSGDPASGPSTSIGQEAQRPARGRALRSALAGALIAFALADVLSIVSGGGELISSLLQGPPAAVRVVEEPPPAPASAINDGPRLQTTSQMDSPAAAVPEAATAPAGVQAAMGETLANKPALEQAPVPEMIASGSNGLIHDRLDSGIRGPAMQTIRGGKLIMGSERDPLAVEERPAHEVAIADFAIGRSEVSFAEYDAFARDTGRRLPDDQGWGRGQRPVINVTWEDARAYARWLSGKTGQRYRLPTEAEWEYAASGGSDSYYWWGYEVGNGLANCFNCGSRWDGWQTAPTGTFGENPYGLQNTAGNVMEWVEDCYHPNYEGAPDDGSAWSEADCGQRVVRGGAFNRPVDALRATYRSHFDQTARLPMLGFRLARDVR